MMERQNQLYTINIVSSFRVQARVHVSHVFLANTYIRSSDELCCVFSSSVARSLFVLCECVCMQVVAGMR